MERRKLITIVSPVFNEEGAAPLFYEKLKAALEPLRSKYDFELIFTNNRSTDRSLELILELRKQDPMVQVLTFSRNFGYQASVLAGLRHACGDAVVVIDVDCEDPPELIPRFIAEWEKGYDIVYGQRGQRPESRWIYWMRKLFYRLNWSLGDYEVILDMAEFALVSCHVRDAMLDNYSTYPFLRTEIAYAGFNRKAIRYDRQPRIFGKSRYNLSGMFAFAMRGILSSSTFLLRFAAYLCPVFLLFTLVMIVLDMTGKLEAAFRLMVAVDLMYIILFVASMCIYVARTYKDGVDRPVFIIDWKRSALNDIPTGGDGTHRRVWTTNKTSGFLDAIPGGRPLALENAKAHPSSLAPKV
jgi:dolichol-phosphate mannosyltransferase